MEASLGISSGFHSITADLIRKFQSQSEKFGPEERSRLIDNLATIYFLATRARDFMGRLETRRSLVEISILETMVLLLREFSDVGGRLLETAKRASEESIGPNASEVLRCVTDQLRSWEDLCNKKDQIIQDSEQYSQQASTNMKSAMNAEGLGLLAFYAEQLLEKLLSPPFFTAAFLSILRLDALCRMATNASTPDPDADEGCRPHRRHVQELFEVSENDQARIDKLAHNIEARMHTIAQRSSRPGLMEKKTRALRQDLEYVYRISSVLLPVCKHIFSQDGTVPFPEWALQVADSSKRNGGKERHLEYSFGTGPGDVVSLLDGVMELEKNEEDSRLPSDFVDLLGTLRRH
ncbi:hypothetical protein PG996_011758 [Apiospora saccharicola]|uniref:Uncharacterized protein n=1 Tax=Apiospora saccharicola TaxID=335842 RepID=A0ABR1UFX7_9PEZI